MIRLCASATRLRCPPDSAHHRRAQIGDTQPAQDILRFGLEPPRSGNFELASEIGDAIHELFVRASALGELRADLFVFAHEFKFLTKRIIASAEDGFDHSLIWRVGRILRKESDDSVVGDDNATGIGRLFSSYDTQERRFAAAVYSNYPDLIGLIEAERDRFE